MWTLRTATVAAGLGILLLAGCSATSEAPDNPDPSPVEDAATSGKTLRWMLMNDTQADLTVEDAEVVNGTWAEGEQPEEGQIIPQNQTDTVAIETPLEQEGGAQMVLVGFGEPVLIKSDQPSAGPARMECPSTATINCTVRQTNRTGDETTFEVQLSPTSS